MSVRWIYRRPVHSSRAADATAGGEPLRLRAAMLPFAPPRPSTTHLLSMKRKPRAD